MKRIALLIAILSILPSALFTQQSLEKYLKPDGTLNVPPGLSASLNARGWRLTAAPRGAPRFTQSTSSNPADTAWDVNFISGDSYINGDVRAVAVIGNDVYIAGAFTSAIGATFTRIIRWDGNTWYPLGSGINATVYALAVIGTDLYAGGDFTSPGAGVARWDGASWHTLGSGTDATVFALATDGSNLYAGGVFGTAGGVGASKIARWNGSTWSALGTGMNATVAAIACAGGDTVYAGGYFSSAGGATVNQVARWDGGSWHAMAGGLDGNVSALFVNGSDLYVGGGFTMAGTVPANSIARWNGSAWDSLDAGIGGSVYAIAASGADLYVGGQFGTAGNVTALNVARWNGSAWSAVGSGVNDVVRGLAARGSDLIAGGVFRTAGADSASRAAIWNGTKWSGMGSGLQFADGSNTFLFALALDGANLYVGGFFDRAGGVKANNIAKWDGSKWSALGAGINGTVTILGADYVGYVNSILIDGPNLYAGGIFDTAGAVPANSVAMWNGSSWSALGNGLRNSGSPASPGLVMALAKYGSGLVAGGYFNLPSGNIAQWTGSAWGVMGTGTDSSVTSIAVSGTTVYAGGTFVHAGGNPAKRVAAWSGATWSALGSGMNAPVNALLQSADGLYAGGSFTSAGGTAAGRSARWSGSAWTPAGQGVSGNYFCQICIPKTASPLVEALAEVNGYLYAGGFYDSAGTNQISSLSGWDRHAWSALGSGLAKGAPLSVGSDSSLPTVYAAAAGGGYLYISGALWGAGGRQTFGLARWRVPPPSRTFDVRAGWNILSVPVIPSNDSVQALFPGASSSAFAYAPGGYTIRHTLGNGEGYWLKYPSAFSNSMFGATIGDDTIAVSPGWNLVGSVSDPIPVSNVTSDPPGMVTSMFFGYAGSYLTEDTIRPGFGYWVKVDTAGRLFLSSSTPPSARRLIRIVPTSERPPLPPEGGTPVSAAALPKHFELEQNYPNPFNPVTEVAYSLPVAAHVTLRVYNTLGELVATLVDKEEPAGRKAVPFDAALYASGVYFYTMEAGGYTETRKMLLLK